MNNEITNCGLVALRNISDLKSVSVRTLINLAEDNGIKLYPYKLTEKDIEQVELPAIFHSDNHFIYIVNKQDLDNYNLTGEVLFTKEQPYNIIGYDSTQLIKGQWVAAGVASAALTLAAAKWVSGNRKEKKAKKAREALKNTFYDIQNEYYQNVNSANSMAQGGLPAATKDYYTNKSQQGVSAGITSINANGGTANDVSKILQGYDDGIGKIASVDAETHLNNIKYYHQVNKDLAGQKTIQWGLNVKQPHDNTLRELSAAQRAGEATKNEAYGDALSALSSFGTSMAGGGGFGKKTTTPISGFGGGSHSSDIYSGGISNVDSGGFGGNDSSNVNRNIEPEQAHVADPFSNNDTDYAEFQKWLQYKNRR